MDVVDLTAEVQEAVRSNYPVVALESTIIAHGLPYPANLECARSLEAAVRQGGAIPATIAVVNGRFRAGLSAEELIDIARNPVKYRKLSLRDLPTALANKFNGATTVSATVHIAALAGINIHATGGVGGVHRGEAMDVSQDILALATRRVVVVSAGVKSVLHVGNTLELLETAAIPVFVWQSVKFPSFYTADSGFAAPETIGSAEELANIFIAAKEARVSSGMLLAVPVPQQHAAESEKVQAAIERALRECSEQGFIGKEVTPFLLRRVAELSEGESLKANVQLAKNNARVAALVACAISKMQRTMGVRTADANGVKMKDGTDLMVVGMAAVDIIATASNSVVGGSSNVGQIVRSIGGVACNVARSAAASADNVGVTMIGVIGDDEHGKFVRSGLSKAQVKVYGIGSSRGVRTPVYAAIHNAEGELLSAIADMDTSSVSRTAISGAMKRIYDGGAPRVCVLDANFPPEVIDEIASAARARGTLVFYEPTSVPKSTRALSTLSNITFVSPNEAELRAMGDALGSKVASEVGYVRAIQRRGVRVVIVTRGSKGAVLYDGDLPRYELAAVKVRNVKNTSGAGDALVGAMCAHVVKYGDGHSALREGLAAGIQAAAKVCNSSHSANDTAQIPARL